MIGLALIGAGRMGRVHAAALRQTGASLVAIHDVDQTAALRLARETGAAVDPTIDATLSRPDVAGVIIATASDTHVDLTLQAVAAGKRVLCEKPLAPSLADAQRCVDALGAGAADVFLGFNRRFDPGHAAVLAAVGDRSIGKLEQLTITSRDPTPPPLDYIPRSGGLFRDMMIHDFDMTRTLLGEEPTRLYAQGSSIVDPQIGNLGDVDTAIVTLSTTSGVQAVIINSRRCAFGFDQRIEAFGSAGMALSDNPRADGFKRFGASEFGSPSRYQTFFMERYGESYRREIESFVRCVADGAPPPINAIDGLKAAYLAEAATESLARGQPIDLDPTGRVIWA